MNLLSQSLFIATCASGLCLVTYYVVVLGRLALYKLPNRESEPTQAVSVVICARNEAENLRQFLPVVLNQDHPDYEVIVVDDASWDGTDEILYKLSVEHDCLSILSVTEAQKTRPGKKFALTLGIKRAQHKALIMIDADCMPKSSAWLRHMTNGVGQGIRLGYGAYQLKPGLLNLLIRFDTWSTALIYLSAALCGKSYMGVGRNLMYTKDVYESQGGFRHHYHVAAGDDDLLVNHANKKFPVSICVTEDGHTLSIPCTSWRDWLRQKKRHMGVSSLYTSSSKLFIGVYYSAQVIFYASLGAGLIWGAWKLTLIVLCAKTLIHLLISHRAGHPLKEKSVLVLLPILEPILLLIQIVSGVMMQVNRTSTWK